MFGTPKEILGHANKIIGPPNHSMCMPIKMFVRRPTKSLVITSTPENSAVKSAHSDTANVNKQNSVVENLQLWQYFEWNTGQD